MVPTGGKGSATRVMDGSRMNRDQVKKNAAKNNDKKGGDFEAA